VVGLVALQKLVLERSYSCALGRMESSSPYRREPLFLVISNGFDAVVVYPHPLVGVSDGDVERQFIVERVVGSSGVIELRERGLGDTKLDLNRSEYKPEDEASDAEEENGYEEEAEDELEKAIAITPTHGRRLGTRAKEVFFLVVMRL
jgi:hypothetical protein